MDTLKESGELDSHGSRPENAGVVNPRVVDNLQHPVLCAWCQRDGQRTVLGYSTVSDSHGICQPCMIKALEEVKPC